MTADGAPGASPLPSGDDGADDITAATIDETTRRDLDTEAFPLPRVPHAMASLWGLWGFTIIAAIGLGVGAALSGSGALLAVALVWGGLWLLSLTVLALLSRGGHSDVGLLRLDRAAHPRFFTVVDDVCGRLATPPPEAVFLINESNAYNATVGGRSCILLGLPSVFAYDVAALRSTLGHELGHHLADDTQDGAILALNQLRVLARFSSLIFPFGWLARGLASLSRPDTLRRSRLNEHAADFWGGVAAGPGTATASLLLDRRAAHLWRVVVDDVVVLREAGLRVQDLYEVVARCRAVADEDGFDMLPSSAETDPDSTHPAERVRAALVESKVQHLPAVAGGDALAIGLFEARDAITRDLTDLYFDPLGRGDGDWLEIVDDDTLWPRYIEAARPQLRAALAAVGHPRLAAPMSSLALFHEVRQLVDAGVRFVAPRGDPTLPGMLVPHESTAADFSDGGDDLDVTVRVVGLLLDVLVADSVLHGSGGFGLVRTIGVGGLECFRPVLADRLAGGERWDDLVNEIELVADRRRALEEWVRVGFGPCAVTAHPAGVMPAAGPDAPWENDTDELSVPTSPAATGLAWERDTEEIVLPAPAADNSDRERSGTASAEEAPAAE